MKYVVSHSSAACINAIVLALMLCLTGCSKSGISNLTHQELAAKRDECVMGNPTSPGRVTACENIKKECERRRKEGHYAC